MLDTEQQLQAEVARLREQVAELTRKEAESRQLAEQYRQAADALASSPEPMVLFDQVGKLTFANAPFFKRWGYGIAGEVLGTSVLDLWANREEARQLFIALHDPSLGRCAGELRAAMKDGRTCAVRVAAHAVLDEAGCFTGGIAVFPEVPISRQFMEQLCCSRKMEAIHRVTRIMAHDFNNILMIIISMSELLLGELGNRTELEEIKMAGERGAALIRTLHSASSKQPVKRQWIDPVALVDRLLVALRAGLGASIRLNFDCPEPEPAGLIRADPGQLEQALTNLINNAREAMPQGGLLTVRLHREIPRQLELFQKVYPDLKPGVYQVIEVSDTGCGMDEQVRSNIFEPFFTTKKAGGRGFGLNTVYGLIKQNNGLVSFDSRPGEGSTFKVYFPWINAACKQDEPDTPGISNIPARCPASI